MTQWLIDRVKARLDALGLGPIEAATKAGIERTFIRDIVDERKNSVTAAGAIKLAQALQAPRESFLFEDWTEPKP